MKKNLRNVLVLSLGLITTIASAQWGANSETWIDNSNSDERSAYTRTSVAADWGGIHLSADVTWDVNAAGDVEMSGLSVYEANASTDVMGFGTLTLGRSDLSFGSGALVSSNSGPYSWDGDTTWTLDGGRYTSDGMSFSMDLAGMSVSAGMFGINNATNYMNASGNFAGANVNILMMNRDNAGTTEKAHGYDLSYAFSDFNVSASMNEDWDGNEMTGYGISYSGIDNMNLSVGRSEYEGNFNMSETSNHNSGYRSGYAGGPGGLADGDENTSVGISYNLGDISLGYTRHTVANDNEVDDGTGTMVDATPDDREANQLSLSYNLNDNCTLGISRWSDDGNAAGDDITWITINITP